MLHYITICTLDERSKPNGWLLSLDIVPLYVNTSKFQGSERLKSRGREVNIPAHRMSGLIIVRGRTLGTQRIATTGTFIFDLCSDTVTVV